MPVTAVYSIARMSEPVRMEVIKRLETDRPAAAELMTLIDEAKVRDRQVKEAAKSHKEPIDKAHYRIADVRKRKRRQEEKRKKEAERDRQERIKRSIDEERATIQAIEMIRERFGADLPLLQTVLAQAGNDFSEFRVRLEHPFGKTVGIGAGVARARPWFQEPEEEWPLRYRC